MKLKKILFLLFAFALAFLPLALFAQAATDPGTTVTPTSDNTFATVVAVIGAIVILARVIVKLTPTPADDSFLEKVVGFLKHLGLHIGCLGFLACLLLVSGCQNPPPTTVGLNTDQDHNITGSVTSQVNSNFSVGVQGSGNPSTGDWSAGVVVVFKDEAAIDQTTQWALEAANAKRVNMTKGGPVFLIEQADWSNTEFRNALIQAIKHGATITNGL